MKFSGSWLTAFFLLLVLGLLSWIAWFYAGTAQTLRWPHPAHPTVFFTWRNRPPIVRQGLGKVVQVPAGQRYEFAVLPPRHVACAIVKVSLRGERPGLAINNHRIIASSISAHGARFETDPTWFHLGNGRITIQNDGANPFFLDTIKLITYRTPCL